MNEYKIAVDLGTTTIEIAILDDNGTVVATDYFLNPQKLYGRDVINRINAATRDRMFVKIMKDMFIKSFKLSVMTLLADKVIGFDKICSICICGNTTMISILLEYDLEELGVYPFNHRLTTSVIKESKELFYKDFPIDCNVFLSGCATAFIGGDVLSGLLSIKNDYEFSDDKAFLFLDLGTNGEMVLYNKKEYYTVSTACGPAFEASSRCSNVYGTNLLDAIALGIKSGKISTEGILDDLFLESGIDILGVHISSDILREILLAKAAIRTGIDILVEASNLNIKDIDTLYIAGGFGFYLNIENACFLGLIPSYLKDKAKIVGNTSLKGSILLLNDSKNIKMFNNLIKKDMKLIQMANYPDYQTKLINNMNFKQ